MEIIDIPGAMDCMGWRVAPQLMRRWLRNPSNIMTIARRSGKDNPLTFTASDYDDQIVKMRWVTSIPRAGVAYQQVCSSWNNPAATAELKAKLRALGWKAGMTTSVSLGVTSMTAIQLDSVAQVNWKGFGSKTDTIDDMLGALGDAAFKVAVVGTASFDAKLKRDIFTATHIGVYVRDTYDFVGDTEPLGVWNTQRCLSKIETVAYFASPAAALTYKQQGFEAIFNRDFSQWRLKNGRGGDFVVYSDVQWTPLNNAVVFL